MAPEELQKLTTEALIKKEKGTKTLIGIFIPIILALTFFCIRDYLKGDEVDSFSTIMIICSIGGMVSLFPELKNIRQELGNRNSENNS